MSEAKRDELDFEDATATAGCALQLMAEHAVPATPQNFEVWFKFALGASPELSKLINILIESKRGFDSATNRSLFQTYVGGDPDRDMGHVEILQQLQALLSAARDYLDVSAADNRSHVAALVGVAAQIEQNGHQFGDQVLRLIAKLIKDGLRADDLAARFGGEELVGVLPGADVNVARSVAERIRQGIANRQVTRRSTGEILSGVTASIGVAQFAPGETISSLFERCDRALYAAKRAGRNRTVSELDRDFAAA